LLLDARGHPAPIELMRERMCALLDEHGGRCRAHPVCRLAAPAERHVGTLLFACQVCGVLAAVV